MLSARVSGLLLGFVFLVSIGLARGAAGESAADAASAAAPEAAGSTDALEEIVVTAQKRVEPLQRTAVSLTAITGDVLQKQGAFKLDDAVQAVPAVNVIGGPAGFLVRIRGEGINIPPNNGDPSVPVMVDGQYNANLVTTFLGLYDVARVEVLRGPQGTLFGKNSTGGLVNIVSNTPVDHEQGMASIGLGNYNLVQTEGMYNTPINDELFLRIAGASTYHTGYLSNGDQGQDSKSARVSLLFKPNEALSALMAAEYSIDSGTPPGSVIGYAGDNPAATAAHGSTNAWYDPAPPGSWWDVRNLRSWADVEADLGWATFSILPSVQAAKTHWHNQFAEGMGSVASEKASLGTYLETNINQYALELHLVSPASAKISWLVGTYFYDAPNWRGANENLGTVSAPVQGGQDYLNPSAATYTDTILWNKDYAVFGQATVPLTVSTRLTLGARTTRDEKRIVYINNGRPSTPFLEHWDSSTEATKTTYKAGIEQDVASNSMLYLQTATGFIGSAFNTTSFIIAPPETLTAYELGSKNRFFEQRLQVNAEIFDNEIKNAQTFYSIANPYVGQTIGGVTITSPAQISGVVPASAREFGGELEMSWLPTAADRVDLTAAYLHARFLKFSDQCVGTGTGCAPGTSSPGYNGGVLPETPRLAFTLGLSHIFQLPGGSALTAHADARWHSQYYLIFNYKDNFPPFFPQNSANQPAATTSNVLLSWTSPRDKWSVTGNVRNVGNTATKTGWFGPYVQLSDPRTYSVNLDVRF